MLPFFRYRWSDPVLFFQAPAPPAEEPVVAAEEPAPADAKPEDQPAPEPTEPAPAPEEPAKEADAPAPPVPDVPVPETTPEEVKMKSKSSPLKISRRLSARVGELFKPRAREVNTPAKVDEAPPKIEEPTPVAPLENPAADSTPANGEAPKKETEETNEPPKVIDATPAPVVAAA